MKRFSRRTLVRQASLLGTGLAVGTSLAATAGEGVAEPSPMDRTKLKIIVTGGHPGDPEYGCGGTIARYTDLGHSVVLLYLNRGDPSEGPGQPTKDVRVLEAEKACGIPKHAPCSPDRLTGMRSSMPPITTSSKRSWERSGRK